MARHRARSRRAPERAPRRRDPSSRELWLIAGLLALLGLAGRIAWYKHYNDALFLRVGPDGMTYFNQAVDQMREIYGVSGGEPVAAVYRDYLPPGYPLFLATLWKLVPLHGVIGEREFWIAAVRAARVAQWLLAAGVTLMTFALARRVLFGYSALLPPLLITASIAMVDVPNLLAAETLLAFLLTATVLLLVKARENAVQAERRAAAERERAATRGEPIEETVVLDDLDDFEPLDEAEDQSRWAALDEPPSAESGRDWTGLCVLLAGFGLSYAVLVQPRFALLIPFAAAWTLRALPKGQTAVFVVVALLLPGGWIARDYAEQSRILPLSIGAQAAVYEDNVDPIGGDGTSGGAAPPACPRVMLASGDDAERQEWADCMLTQGIDQITAHPRDSLAAVGDRLAAMLSPWNSDYARGPYSSDLFSYPELVPRATLDDPAYATTRDWLNVLWILIYAALLLAGALAMWAEGPGSDARLMTLPLISLPIATFVYHGENLHRLPLLPLVTIAISLGLLHLGERLLRNGSKQTDQ
ncbi:MAG: hypothetical protein HZB14_01250 [Actinobacteria bacterium]|nr:hypothetical protein [Actinomycetota bacterium]